MMTRREFLKKTAIAAGGILVPVTALEILDPAHLEALKKDKGVRWVFLVDIEKCVGCGMCVRACKTEMTIPYDVNVTSEWVERYLTTKDGTYLRRLPEGGARRLHTRKGRSRE